MVKFSLVVASLFLLAHMPLKAQSHDDAFSSDGLVKIPDATKQANFTLALHPETPIPTGSNVLWCNTMQLAWNEAINLVGEKLHFANAPEVVAHLNREDYSKADLDPSCYVAIADFERNHVEDEIRAALQEKFNGQASPHLIPNPPKNPAPDDFLAYAYLFKNLSFANKFYKNDFYFVDKQVKGFGFSGEDQNDPVIRNQAKILYYESNKNFVVQLSTKSADEQLILAKVDPRATLSDTISAVMKHVNSPDNITLGRDDKLLVPLLNFDVTSHFLQLEGLIMTPSPSAKVGKLVIASAMQNVRFQLNEEGVKLKSEAAIEMKELAIRLPLNTHELIFDKPFLIIMKQKSAAQPYFALWVGNTDLLTPAGD